MNRHLQYTLPDSSLQIGFQDQIVLLGSCFAEHIGELLNTHLFTSYNNPNGILFHPWNIAFALEHAALQIPYTEADRVCQDETYYSWHHHGKIGDAEADILLEKINKDQAIFYEKIKNAKTLILTWGNAYGYFHNEKGIFVANCHKVPQIAFSKLFVRHFDIVDRYTKTLDLLWNLNPSLQILISISPVRYLKDGMIENQRSKAQLIDAAHTLVEMYDQVHYFPSYEIVIDDLRDYRYYENDMLHPSQTAIQYVWDQFIDLHLAASQKPLFEKVKNYLYLSRHTPHHTHTMQYKKWQEKIKDAQLELEQLLSKTI